MLFPNNTNGATRGSIARTGTYDTEQEVIRFANNADDYAHFVCPVPDDLDASSALYLTLCWTDDDSSSGGISFFVQVKGVANDEAPSAIAWNSQEITDDLTASHDDMISAEITMSTHGLAVSDTVYVQVYRDVDDSDDDLNGTNAYMHLLWLKIEYVKSQLGM